MRSTSCSRARLTLVVEGEEDALERGELIRVAPEVRFQLINRGLTVVLLALGGTPEHDGRDGDGFASREGEHRVRGSWRRPTTRRELSPHRSSNPSRASTAGGTMACRDAYRNSMAVGSIRPRLAKGT